MRIRFGVTHNNATPKYLLLVLILFRLVKIIRYGCYDEGLGLQCVVYGVTEKKNSRPRVYMYILYIYVFVDRKSLACSATAVYGSGRIKNVVKQTYLIQIIFFFFESFKFFIYNLLYL